MDVAAIGRQFGLDEEQTRAALDALVPVVAAGVRRTAQSPEGLQEIFKQVLTGRHGGVLDDAGAVSLDRAKPAGDEVLGQIFGKKQVSREVAQQLSATSGVGAAILKQLLPIVATMVLGTLAKKMGSGGATANEQAPQSGSAGGGGTRRHLEGRVGRRPGCTASGSAAAVHAGTGAGTGRIAGRHSRRHIEWRPGAGDREAESHLIKWAESCATSSAAICRAVAASIFRHSAGHLRKPSPVAELRWTTFSAAAPAAVTPLTTCQLGREDGARPVTASDEICPRPVGRG